VTWTVDPLEANQRLDERYPGREAGQLAAWAAWTVEGMDYLADIDSQRPATYSGQEEQRAIDLSHARWATVDAVTAIDLCAAALGRMHCGYPDERGREMDFGNAKKNSKLRDRRDCQLWIEAVTSDPAYDQTWKLRDALVHRTARSPIHVALSPALGALGVGGGARFSRVRLHLSDPEAAIPVGELVPRCRDLARRHVEAFLSGVERL
jgi:hypothetical protein